MEHRKDAHLSTKTQETYIDEDGVIVEQIRHRYISESDKEFFITFCKAVALFKDLNGAEVKLLAWMNKSTGFNSNMVTITSEVKDKICHEMDISHKTIANALPKMVEKGILYRENKGRRSGCYYINPEYFWKGDLSERNRTLKYVLEVVRTGSAT